MDHPDLLSSVEPFAQNYEQILILKGRHYCYYWHDYPICLLNHITFLDFYTLA